MLALSPKVTFPRVAPPRNGHHGVRGVVSGRIALQAEGDGAPPPQRPRVLAWALSLWAASTTPIRSWWQRARSGRQRNRGRRQQDGAVGVVGAAPTRAAGGKGGPAPGEPRRRRYPPLPEAPSGLAPCERRAWRKEQRFEQMKARRKAGRPEERRRAARRKKAQRQQLLAKMTEEEKRSYWFEERRKQVEIETSLAKAFEQGRPRVVINCSFGDYMQDRENRSLAQQVKLLYSEVKRTQANVQLHLTSLGPDNPASSYFDSLGLPGWKMHVHEQSVWELSELFPPEDLVILTPDAGSCLETVEEDKIYVIGGLVDRRPQKHRTFNQAQEREVGPNQLRRLPLKEHAPKGVHSLLNIDVVVQILLERLQGAGWPQVLSGIDVSTVQGDSMLDAGIVDFAKGNYLDEMRSWHFKHHVTYCVAPVVTNRTQGPVSGSYDFWAVGRDCCSLTSSDFRCGAWGHPHADRAIRVLADEDVPFYRLAVQQAETLYGVVAANPVFFKWSNDPEAEVSGWAMQAFKNFLFCVATAFVASLIALTCAAWRFAWLGRGSAPDLLQEKSYTYGSPGQRPFA
ncbi:TRMT10B [Symbiodinium natans]|uniref:tRNA (guanine(9)-N(1))-methyltransferase n=1 Tax=Symbiodinium natans TaxID=878477 RepID=A0A812SAP8_9DINO|nr:TRMT10B [Symbiodinium natans]